MSDQTRNLPKLLRDTAEAIRPHVETLLDLRDIFADYRKAITEAGGDWMALKNLVKAQAEDARDDDGAGERVEKLLQRADLAASYADILGIGAKLNENYSFVEVPGLSVPATEVMRDEVAHWDARRERELQEPIFDQSPGEVIEDRPAPVAVGTTQPVGVGDETTGANTESAAVPAVCAVERREGERVSSGPLTLAASPDRDGGTAAKISDDWQCPPIPEYLRRIG